VHAQAANANARVQALAAGTESIEPVRAPQTAREASPLHLALQLDLALAGAGRRPGFPRAGMVLPPTFGPVHIKRAGP
jgi:hypothetical protein